jgi:hypothetical protein
MKAFVIVWPPVEVARYKDRGCRIDRQPVGSFEIEMKLVPHADSVIATSKAKTIGVDSTMFKVSTVIFYDVNFQSNRPGCDFTLNVVPI